MAGAKRKGTPLDGEICASHCWGDQQATEVSRLGSDVLYNTDHSLGSKVPCAKQGLTTGIPSLSVFSEGKGPQLIPFGTVSSLAQLGPLLVAQKASNDGHSARRLSADEQNKAQHRRRNKGMCFADHPVFVRAQRSRYPTLAHE